jgi:DNA-binding HxlR family transcriptional regulator
VNPFGEYCAFTKSLEYLGDRWSLLIVRNLALYGPQGFNAIADGLPGISRPVLVRRLRTLLGLGLVARDPAVRTRQAPYCLTPGGEQLLPTIMTLRTWAERWVPEDQAEALHDPDVVLWWLVHRIDVSRLPGHPVVVSIDIRGGRPKQVWLLLEPGQSPALCAEDPGLVETRYVYVEADAATLQPISRGVLDWTIAVRDGSVHLYGDPGLLRDLPGWFGSTGAAIAAGSKDPA